MTTLTQVRTQDLLDEALALLEAVVDELDRGAVDDDALLFAAGRASDVVTLLEEAGASSRDLQTDLAPPSVLVGRAIEVLDRIDPAERPPRLLPARAELGVLALEVTGRS